MIIKTIAATDTTPESSSVTFTTPYSNPYAIAAAGSSNLAKSFRDALASAKTNGQVNEDCIFIGVDEIVEGYEELQDAGDTDAMKSFKASLATQCRKLNGFGCKVHQGKLLGTTVGAGKGAQKSALVTAIETFEGAATPEQVAEMLELITKAAARYAENDGKALAK